MCLTKSGNAIIIGVQSFSFGRDHPKLKLWTPSEVSVAYISDYSCTATYLCIKEWAGAWEREKKLILKQIVTNEENFIMETLKQQAMNAISILPDTANLNDIMATFQKIMLEATNHNNGTEKPVSCLELALAHNLVGCIKDAPEDLSINNVYMEGYGL